MEEIAEHRSCRLAYRIFRESHPEATHEESLSFARTAWRAFIDKVEHACFDDEPEQVIVAFE